MSAFSDPSGTITAQASSMGIPVSDPNVANAIASIQAAAKAEGLDPNSLETASRVSTLFQSFQQVYSHMGSGVANAATTSLNAARAFVTQNHELSGAIDTTTGLIAAANNALSGNETPIDIASDFSGPVITAMVGAGTISMGLGAAIVAGLAIGKTLLDNAGVFPPPPQIEVCPGFKVQTQPTFTIGCVAAWDPLGATAPNSPDWRRFPEQNNPNDAAWFTLPKNGNQATFQWKGARWQFPFTATSDIAIDEAFPTWWPAHFAIDSFLSTGMAQALGIIPKNLSAEQTQALRDFTGMFFQAWKANAEYFLNGRKGADDVTVLQHVVEIWNRSHEAGQGVDIAFAPIQNMPVGPPYSNGPYFSTLIQDLAHQDATDVLTADGKLHLNTGFVLPVPGRITATIAKARAKLAATHVAPSKLPLLVHPLQIKNPNAVKLVQSGAKIGLPAPASHVRRPLYVSGGAVAGFAVGGPIGAAIGAGIGYFLGK